MVLRFLVLCFGEVAKTYSILTLVTRVFSSCLACLKWSGSFFKTNIFIVAAYTLVSPKKYLAKNLELGLFYSEKMTEPVKTEK